MACTLFPPVARAQTPVITALDPPALAAGSGGFTLTVSGTGFTNGAVVRWNGSDRTTQYVGPTQVKATISAADIAQIGEAKVVVAQSGGASSVTSAEARFTVYMNLGVSSADMVFDPFTRQIFVSQPNFNSLTPIEPQSGMQGSAVFLGSPPGRLAIAYNGEFVYLGMDSAAAVWRYNIPANALSMPITLGNDASSGQPLVAKDIVTMPWNVHAVAVATQTSAGQSGGVAMWDDGTKRPDGLTSAGGAAPVTLRFLGQVELFGISDEATPSFYGMDVTDSGLSLWTTKPGAMPSAPVATGGQYLYSAAGAVFEPNLLQAQPAFVSPDANAALGTASRVVVDFVIDRAVFATPSLLDSGSGTSLLVFAMQSRAYLGRIDLPGITYVDGLVRWGSDGLGLHAPARIITLRTSLITPSASSNPTPELDFISPSLLPRGSGNLWFSLYGTQFVPGAIVLWDGVERNTWYLGPTWLRAAIPASDMGLAGTNTVMVRNPAPAGGDSSALTVTVTRPVPAIVLPHIVEFGAQPISSSTQSVLLQNQGPEELVISSAQTSGDFQITQSCPAFVSENTSCSFGLVFHPTGFGLRTGDLSITDSGLAKTFDVALSGDGDIVLQLTRPPRPTRSGAGSNATRGKLTLQATVGPSGVGGLSFECSATGYVCTTQVMRDETESQSSRVEIELRPEAPSRAARLRTAARAGTVSLKVRWGATSKTYQFPLPAVR